MLAGRICAVGTNGRYDMCTYYILGGAGEFGATLMPMQGIENKIEIQAEARSPRPMLGGTVARSRPMELGTTS